MVSGFFCSGLAQKQQSSELGGRGSGWSVFGVVCLLSATLLVFSPFLLRDRREWESFSADANVLPREESLAAERDCDFFTGRWVYDASYPLYEAPDCPFAEIGFRCKEKGRPDDGYRHWRWQPDGCNLPRFDAQDVLERLRGLRVVFVGDSMGRTQWESFICLLAEAVPDKTSFFEVNGRKISKTARFMAVRFSSFDLTVEFYRSPYLIASAKPPERSPKRVRSTLVLDVMDPALETCRGANILVVNSGHWWTRGKTYDKNVYFAKGGKLQLGIKVPTAHSLALQTWASWVERNINTSETNVFFRNFAPDHWGGFPENPLCADATEPNLQRLPYSEMDYPQVGAVEQALHSKRTLIPVLNVTVLSDMRIDGHVSKWGDIKMDCSHWCLPGVPDVWNELLYASLLQKGQGVWGPRPQSSLS